MKRSMGKSLLSMAFVAVTMVMSFGMSVEQAEARPLTTEEKVRDFEQLVSMIKAGYGPLEYKREAIGLDINALHTEYLAKVAASRSNAAYYYLVNQFIAAFKDSHFSGSIPVEHRASLGFRADLVEGKVLVEAALVPGIGLDRGDEIVTFNDRPVAEELAKLEPYLGMGRPETTKRYAALLLGSRPGSIMPVPQGTVRLGIRRSNTGNEEAIDLEWIQRGEPLAEDETFETSEHVARFETGGAYDPRSFSISIKNRVAELLGDDIEASYMCSGATRIAIPEGATIIMETPFVAYYHAHPTRPDINIGYLRIPHYSPDMDAEGEADPYETRFEQYEYAVAVLEANTAGLIIDQDHNCGGSVTYLERLVGLFAESEYSQMQFSLLANRPTALEFQSYLTSMDPRTLWYHSFKQTVDLITETWESGASRLTPKIGILGNRTYHPHSVRYTKPIVMLIDELSGSGGDAFPSILGGIGRATLMGRATMGAGGHVEAGTPLVFSGHTMSMTKSLFYRPDGVPVENNGAIPHVDYIPTVADFTGKYVDYQKAYLAEVLKLIDGGTSTEQ